MENMFTVVASTLDKVEARVNEINENNSVIIKESNETIKNKIKLTNDDWGMSLDEFIDSKLQAVDNINDDDYVKIKQAVKILFSNSNNYDSEKVNSTIISVLDSILKWLLSILKLMIIKWEEFFLLQLEQN